MNLKDNRIASLFNDFADRFELPHSVGPESDEAILGVPLEGQVIQAHYFFCETQDSYEWVAALGKVGNHNKRQVAYDTITSSPIRGITERITSDGRFIILGSRDGLAHSTNREVQRNFMDDVAHITEAYDQFKTMSAKPRNRSREEYD